MPHPDVNLSLEYNMEIVIMPSSRGLMLIPYKFIRCQWKPLPSAHTMHIFTKVPSWLWSREREGWKHAQHIGVHFCRWHFCIASHSSAHNSARRSSFSIFAFPLTVREQICGCGGHRFLIICAAADQKTAHSNYSHPGEFFETET